MKRSVWIVGLLALASFVNADWATPKAVPLARLIANTEAKVRKNADDGSSRFLLARLYSLQYAGASAQVGIYDPDREPNLPQWEKIQVNGPAKHSSKAAEALWRSITHYEHATQLLERDARVRLGQGWMFEEASKWVEFKSTASPAEAKLRKLKGTQWLQRAVDSYRKSYDLAKQADSRQAHRELEMESMASLEAAGNLLRLASSRQITLSSAYQEELTVHMAAMNKKPTMITPIVFPLAPGTPYSAIDNPKAKVKFDLDGSGLPRRWSWITPRAAFLCWHPLGDGKIDSARDLFGNATFWMFFRNGYDALAALDDNRDGNLTGLELRFIGVWHDRNANGISEPAEVKSLAAHGITRIAVHAEGKQGNVWFNRTGIGLRNGRTLPTYDWVSKRQ